MENNIVNVYGYIIKMWKFWYKCVKKFLLKNLIGVSIFLI
jgi:hypothetical protein